MARAAARKAVSRTSKRTGKVASASKKRPAAVRKKAPARKATGPAFDALEKRVSAALARVPPMALDGLWPNRRWTHEIKAHLGAMGLEAGHAVFADECLGAGPQWLFALCWVDLRKGRMRGIPLAMEVEWNLNLGEIAEDFDKLVQSTALHRVMVFEQRNAADVAMVLKSLKARVNAYGPRKKGDRYLFAGYAFTERKLIFDLLVV